MGGAITAQGNDYHPPVDVRPGEKFVKQIYDQLRKNDKVWEKSLLVITFDEHGGTYDHVTPPWGAPAPGDGHRDKGGFLFNRYGVRVPTILASPWVKKSTVFRPPAGKHYDHTSIISTVLKWRGIDPATSGLGKRVSQAPSFEDVIQRSRARTDQLDLRVAPAPTLRSIKLDNQTNTKIKMYLGSGSAAKKAYVLKATKKYKRASSESFNANRDLTSHDYWVAVGYWAGPSSDKEPVDRESGPEWRLLWVNWRHILHHQTMTVFQAPIATKFTGNDTYKKGSKITITNKTASRIYYHLYSKNERTGRPGLPVQGYLDRGKSFPYPSGSDTLRWKYTVNFSSWVGDTTVQGGEKVDGTINRNWRFHWSTSQNIKRNATLTITQTKPAVRFDPIGWDIQV